MRVPVISNLELTNRCNFACPYCQNQHEDGDRPKGDIDVELVEALVENGDFESTVFLELQQNGEPTLHSHFADVIEILRPKIKYLSMSTNGTFVGNQEAEFGVKEFDLVTLSIHPQTTQEIMDRAVDFLVSRNVPVRVQVVGAGWPARLDFDRHCDKPSVWRDNFPERHFGMSYGYKFDCLDLHTSVAVQWDGDVVPCCNVVGKQRVLGNLGIAPLQEIWEEFDHKMFPYCKTCASPSPFAFRMAMLADFFKRRA